MLFFFKQKTAYEMRISDWSSDVCSSDLLVISGSFSLPTTGSFHLSFTVLFSIGSSLMFSLTRRSSQIHTEFLVFHATWDIDTLAFFIFYTRLSLSLVHFSKMFLKNKTKQKKLILILINIPKP